MNREVSDGWRPGDPPLPLSPLSHSPSKTPGPVFPQRPRGAGWGLRDHCGGCRATSPVSAVMGRCHSKGPVRTQGSRVAEPAWRARTRGRSLWCDLSSARSDRVTLSKPLRLRSSISSPPPEPGQRGLSGRRRGAQKLGAVMISRGHPSDSRWGELSDKMHSCDAERTVGICSSACACAGLCGLRAQHRTWEGAGWQPLARQPACPPPGMRVGTRCLCLTAAVGGAASVGH